MSNFCLSFSAVKQQIGKCSGQLQRIPEGRAIVYFLLTYFLNYHNYVGLSIRFGCHVNSTQSSLYIGYTTRVNISFWSKISNSSVSYSDLHEMTTTAWANLVVISAGDHAKRRTCVADLCAGFNSLASCIWGGSKVDQSTTDGRDVVGAVVWLSTAKT